MKAKKNTMSSLVREKLFADSVHVEGATKICTVRFGFFYTHGITSENKVKEVLSAFPDAKILEQGEVWKAFNGGASVANQSHWFVKFTLPQFPAETNPAI